MTSTTVGDLHSHASDDNASTAPLPSFYSPQLKAASVNSQSEDEAGHFSLPPSNLSQASASAIPAHVSSSSTASQFHPAARANKALLAAAALDAVPASLISPAFTPPTTPGAHTPVLQREPRSIKVDSTDLENGGVGAKRPRLLETLPEVNCVVRARIPTTTGTEMYLHLYTNNADNKEHLAIVFGQQIRSKSLDAPRPGETEMDRMIRGAYIGRLYPGRTKSTKPDGPVAQQPVPEHGDRAPYVRIHSECYTGETAWSARCDCGEQLNEAARILSLPSSSPEGGVIIYLRQEGRGIGLGEKLKAYNLQDLGSDTVEANLLLRHPADARSYGLATAMLMDLGLGGDKGVKLLTNNPEKIRAIEGPNREVVVRERVAMVPLSWRSAGKTGVQGAELAGYLKTKIEKMGHMLSME